MLAMRTLLSQQLSGEQEEWLLRAATGSRRGIMPAPIVAALVAAELGERNERGTLDVNEAGWLYLKLRNLPTRIARSRLLR